MRRLLIGGLVLAVILAGVLAFAADLDLKSAKVTVFSNTLASPTLSLANAPSDSVQAGTTVTSQATLDDETATAGGTVTYRFYNDGTCTTLHPTLHTAADTETVTSGSVSASDGVEITKSGAVSWQATYSGDGNNQPATSACKVLTVTAAAPSKLAFSQQPSASSEAGVAFAQQPKVEVRDTYDNLVDTSTASIHLAITASTGDPTAQLDCLPDPDPSNNQAAVAGVATFSGCRVDKAMASFSPSTLTASSASVTDAISESFVITPGAATKLVITGSTTQVAGTTNDLTITARDNFTNVATAYTGQKSLTFSGANPSSDPATDPTVEDKDGNSVNFGVATPITFASGVALSVSGVSNGVMTLYKAETVDIAVTDGSISATGTDRLNVIVSAAAADKLAFTTQPSATSVAGDDFSSQPVVEVRDALGNKVETDTAVVHLALTGGDPTGVLECDPASNNQTANDGVATFSGCFVDKADTGYQLVASSTGLDDATSSAFTITAGTATKLLLAGSPNQVAGTVNNLTITAVDEFDNADEAYDGLKSLTFSGAIASTDPVTEPRVTPATGPAVLFGLPTSIQFNDGVATVSSGSNGAMTLYKVEVADIHVTDGSIETAEEDELVVTVTAAAFTRFDLELASPQLNGGIFSGAENTLTALDDYGNPIVDFSAATTNVTITANAPLSGTVSGLGSGDDNVLNQSGDFQQGVADLNSLGMVYTGALGTGTFTATAGSVSDNSAPVTINAGAATKFVITGSPSQAAGGTNSITITAKDASGNTATGYTGDKQLTFTGANDSTSPVTDPTVTDKDAVAVDFGSPATITFTNGVATSSMTLYRVETAFIVATQGSVTTTLTDRLEVAVTAGPASALDFTVQPSNANANVAISPPIQVQILDAYGNAVTSGTHLVTLSLTLPGPASITGNTASSSGGVAVFNNVTVDTTGSYTLDATSGSFTPDTSSSFTISP